MGGSSGPWRTFVAFPIAEATRAGLAREISRLERLDRRLRVVPSENLHLTVAFLGDTRPEAVTDVASALAEVARRFAPFSVRVEGLGAFPRAANPRVVWAGVREVDAEGRLEAIAVGVGAALASLGFPPEARRYHAHVTLARLEARGPEPALERSLTGGCLQGTYMTETLSDLQLMISERIPPAATTRYRPLATLALGAVSL